MIRRSSARRPAGKRRPYAVALCFTALVAACGARSSLLVGGGSPDEGAGGATSSASSVGGGPSGPCDDGKVEACGSNVGACVPGQRTCVAGAWGPCEGAIGPTPEKCNDIDDNCDGQVDEGFGLGEPCDGPDNDLCLDDVMTCNGCSAGPDILEVCNGVDDNCNGIVDADCDKGDCQPDLEVIGSTPSSPNCIDFPVEKGSMGTIEYPCTGGAVTATLGSVSFTGSVKNGFVTLDGTKTVPGPDTCTWKTSHHIEGVVSSGKLSYSYKEMVVASPPGVSCWQPCTEVGTIQIHWSP